MCIHTPEMGSLGESSPPGGCRWVWKSRLAGHVGAVFVVGRGAVVEGPGRRRMRRESQRFGELGEGRVCRAREERIEDQQAHRVGLC